MCRADSLWCWGRLKAGGEGDDRGWDGWMASATQWTWVWASSGRWWRTGRPGVLQPWGCEQLDTTERLNNYYLCLADLKINQKNAFGWEIHFIIRNWGSRGIKLSYEGQGHSSPWSGAPAEAPSPQSGVILCLSPQKPAFPEQNFTLHPTCSCSLHMPSCPLQVTNTHFRVPGSSPSWSRVFEGETARRGSGNNCLIKR